MADASSYVGWRRAASMTSGLVGSTAVNSAGGFAFWWVAARFYPTPAVGLGAAALSATLLLAQIAELGLGTQFAGALHKEYRPLALLNSGLIACAVAGMVVGLVFLLVGPYLAAELRPLSATPVAVVVFTLGVSLGAATSVLDQVLSATWHGAARVARNAAFSVSRLGLLILAATTFGTGGVAIVGSSSVGLAVSLLVLPVLFAHTRTMRPHPAAWSRLRSMTSVAISHHVLNLSRSAGVWILPLLVTILVSTEATAAFYVALMVSNFTTLIGSAASFTLYVMGTRTPHLMDQHLRFSLGIATIAAVGGSLVLIMFGRTVLGIFGDSYAATGGLTIALLALTSLPLAIRDQWLSIERVRGRVRLAAAAGVASLLIELLAAALGALFAGTEGLASFRLLALSSVAVVVLPRLRSASARADEPLVDAEAIEASAEDLG